MKMTNPNSEVAQLLQRISEQYEAAERAMTGFAVTAKHEFITARLEQIGVCHQHFVYSLSAAAKIAPSPTITLPLARTISLPNGS
ncbi:MAG: hypothetical protein WCD86_17450 [Ktedonobacteraceae bacterium]